MIKCTPSRVAATLLLFAYAASPGAFATELPPDVLAQSRWMKLTKSDYDAALSRVPSDKREEFATSPRRVQSLLNNLLVVKSLAAQAKLDGIRPQSSSAPRAGPSPEQALANAELARIDEDAARAFDAKKDAFLVKAREIYTLDRDKYRVEEEMRFSDIAVTFKDRGEAAALARAQEARERVVAGEDFAKVAREYSDDPTTRQNGGALPLVTRERLAKEFADGVFALTRVGEISRPIKAPNAYHVVRLDERRPARVQPFDEVRDKLLQELRARYVAEQRDARIQAIHRDPTLVVNQKAVDALVVPYDAAAAKRGTTVPVPGSGAASSAVLGNAAPSVPPASAAK
jgi:peptidyl-prolyl cis-trans isomerase C